MSVYDVENKEEFEELLESTEEFVLFLHADWASPSVALMENLRDKKEEIPCDVHILNVVELPAEANVFEAKGVPMLVWMKDGNIVKTQVGFEDGKTFHNLFTNLGD